MFTSRHGVTYEKAWIFRDAPVTLKHEINIYPSLVLFFLRVFQYLIVKALKHIGHYIYIYTANCAFCPHSVFMCFVWIWEQTAIISLYNINWLVCITETECVYCAVRTGSLYIILRSAHTVYLCVLCGSENKQRLFSYTKLSDWLL